MLRFLVLGVFALFLLSGIGYSASMAGTVKSLAGVSGSVPHCKASNSQIAVVSGAIDTITATVVCNVTGSYLVKVTLVSGAGNRTGQTTVALTANTPANMTIDISPNLTISGSTYTATWEVKAG